LPIAKSILENSFRLLLCSIDEEPEEASFDCKPLSHSSANYKYIIQLIRVLKLELMQNKKIFLVMFLRFVKELIKRLTRVIECSNSIKVA